MNGKVDSRRQEVQQAVKNACDELNTAGVDARNYVEQLAWLFFLKAFDESESKREQEADFDDCDYERRLGGEFAWSSWSKRNPDDMLEFVQGPLWTKLTSTDPKKGLGEDLMAQRFRRIFDNVRNYCRHGVTFARVVGHVDKLHFADDTDVHVLSEIYEDLLKRVAADSAGYAGEFYTQRHIIRAMVDVVKPSIGDRIYDPSFGTAGFLGEAADFIRDPKRGGARLSARQLETLEKSTFYGLELKPLTYLLGSMNMILHGIEGANLELADTLEVHSENKSENDKYDVILSNPPYGGKLAKELQNNFRVKSSATECLFLQHIMASLAKGGKAAVVLPEGVLTQAGANGAVREELLRRFNLHTVLSLPQGCFLPYTNVKTDVIFFDRPHEDTNPEDWVTKEVWFYELTNDGFECRTSRRPIEGSQLPDFVDRQLTKDPSECSWSKTIDEIAKLDFDLSARNPNKKHDFDQRGFSDVLDSTLRDERRIDELYDEVSGIARDCRARNKTWSPRLLADVAEINPRRPTHIRELPDDMHVTFVPMPAVSQFTGTIDEPVVRQLADVRKGFTYFEDEDVIFAKITPCMQNGKSAVARELTNGLGFGSTEFHVIRPDQSQLLSAWAWLFVRRIQFRVEATDHFRGAVGQQRVPANYLEKAEIPLPDVQTQSRVLSTVTEIMKRITEIEELKSCVSGARVHLWSLRDSVLRDAFDGKLS